MYIQLTVAILATLQPWILLADDANFIRRTLIYYSSQSLEAETALSSQRGPGARFLQRMGSFFGLR
jgi:hypothetical protein